MDLKKKTITVNEEDWRALGDLAESYGLNRLQLVRLLIKAHLQGDQSIGTIMARFGQSDKKSA